MMRSAMRFLGVHSEDAVMVGDRMDTDVRIGTESGMETILVLSGLTTREMANRFPYGPTHIADSVADLER
jgi:NagD protein